MALLLVLQLQQAAITPGPTKAVRRYVEVCHVVSVHCLLAEETEQADKPAVVSCCRLISTSLVQAIFAASCADRQRQKAFCSQIDDCAQAVTLMAAANDSSGGMSKARRLQRLRAMQHPSACWG